MNRLYNIDNRKDRFLKEHLLPNLIKYMENSNHQDSTMEQIASMYIFPYRTQDGVRFGSLREPDISWYFAPDEPQRMSTESYRIIADELFKPEHFKRFQQLFQAGNHIMPFSNDAVLKDLVHQMSKETDYTPRWWTCAFDVFQLWNPNLTSSNLTKASSGIRNPAFLFEKGTEESRLKKDLIRFGVLKDIRTDVSEPLFWNRIPSDPDQNSKAFRVLKMLGIPDTFVKKHTDQYPFTYSIHPDVMRFARRIAEKMTFPVSRQSQQAECCRICHDLFLNALPKEYPDLFRPGACLVEPLPADGIPVENDLGEYVPLSWHLFYGDGDSTNTNRSLQRFEHLRVDLSRYDPRLRDVFKTLHRFSDVKQSADQYDVAQRDATDFYRWVWGYSQNPELADTILKHFSDNSRPAIRKELNNFVMSVIGLAPPERNSYCFQIALTSEEAFANADTINHHISSFEQIFPVVCGRLTQLDVRKYVDQILNDSFVDMSTREGISSDPLLAHVYAVADPSDEYGSTYVLCRRSGQPGEKILLLWPSEDENSLFAPLVQYISEHYHVYIHLDEDVYQGTDVNWASAYQNLAKGVRDFIRKRTKVNSTAPYGQTASLGDVETAADEAQLWQGLKKQREEVLQAKDSWSTNPPGNISAERSRQFLYEKYKGRCQLCHKRIVTDVFHARYYTFRQVKPSHNPLADLESNLLCLCPSCWGELGYGSYMGQDLQMLYINAREYARELEKSIQAGDLDGSGNSLVSLYSGQENSPEGFQNPIVFRVIVNGKERMMVFSWEHFLRIAFLLQDAPEE